MNLELTKANAELQNISNQKSSLQKQVDDINKINEIKEIFSLFDKNGSGSVSIKEIGNLYRALGFTPTEVELNQIVHDLDSDGSGAIEFSEFLEMFQKYEGKPFTENQLKTNTLFS